MPRFVGHYVGVSFQAELLAMTLLGLLNSTLEWYPFDWTHQVKKIWELSLSQNYFLFYTDFEYWIKTILTWIVITRKIVAYIYTFLYMVNLYPILTWSRPNLLLPWLILSFFQNFILKSIVIMIFLWLWGGERFSLIRTIEFFLVEFLSLITSAYIWYAIACSCIQLKRIENIRRIRKALRAKYSIVYDLFSSDGGSSMEISKESSYGSSLGGRRHMSLPNLNEAFYRSIFIDNYSDNKLSRSLTTLSTINSLSDSEGFISQIVRNTDFMPADKCMKLLGITDVDVINARARIRKGMLSASPPPCPRMEDNYATSFSFEELGIPKKHETERIHAIIKSREIRDPSIVDYLMTKTRISETASRTDGAREIDDRKDNYATIGRQEREIERFTLDTETTDKKTVEESYIRPEKSQIVESEMVKEFKCPRESAPVDFANGRTDRKVEEEEAGLLFLKKKKKTTVCPLMKEFIETRPCFPLVGRRKFKECLFKKETVPPCPPPFPCFSARRNKQLNNVNLGRADTTVACQVERSDVVPTDDSTIVDRGVRNYESSFRNSHSVQDEGGNNAATMREMTNEGSQHYLNSKESCKAEIPDLSMENLPKELLLDPRRNFNDIFNNRSNVLPLADVWSTIGCLPFRQKFNFARLHDRELHFGKSLFKPSNSQELLDRGRPIVWSPSSTELLVKVPEQVVRYNGAEYKPVATPGTSNDDTRYVRIEYPESRGKLEDDNPFYVSQGSLKETRNNDDLKAMTSTQTTESIDNYNYEIVRLAGNANNYVMIYDTVDTTYPKFVPETRATSSLDRASGIKDLKNNSYYDVSKEDSIENEFCCCKEQEDSHRRLISENLNTLSLASYSKKPPAYPKTFKKRSLRRLAGIKKKKDIAKLSSDDDDDAWRKRLAASTGKEHLEMKALRAYNEITLFEDKREMGEKTRRMTKAIYSFVDDAKSFNDVEGSSSEFEIEDTGDSSFEWIASLNNDKLSYHRYGIESTKRKLSCSRLPDIQNKDAAVMLNLLDRHGSHWFKQELERILATGNSRVNAKQSEPSRYASKLDEFLTSRQKIVDSLVSRDGRELDRSCGKGNASLPFRVPLSYNYLRTRSVLDANRNVTNETRDIMMLNSMEVPTVGSVVDLDDFAEFTEKNEKGEKEEEEEEEEEEEGKERETRTTNLPKEDESENAEITSKNDDVNTAPFQSIDDSNRHRNEQVRRRNMSLHMMHIARNIGWSLRPNGIVLMNKNLHGQSLESTNHRGSQQRDIIDDATASLLRAAFSHKSEIIIRTFPRDYQSTTDRANANERSTSIFDDIIRNAYRSTSTNSSAIDEFVLRANDEITVHMGDAPTLPNIREDGADNETNDLPDISPSSRDSMETERNFLNDNLSFESISTIDRSDETRKINIEDPRIDSSEEETTEDAYQPSLELIIAFFSFILTYYVRYLRSCLFSLSNSSSSFYVYRPCDVHSDSASLDKSFSEKIPLNEESDALALSNSSNNANLSSESVFLTENNEEASDEVDNEDELSIETTDQRVSTLHDSFDSMYSRSTLVSENAISVGADSSMEEFS